VQRFRASRGTDPLVWAGAAAYLLKSMLKDELLAVVRWVQM
jgi:hypothetical protein